MVSITMRSGDLQTHYMIKRSWLKLVSKSLKPLFSSPSRYSAGTRTSSNVIYVVELALSN